MLYLRLVQKLIIYILKSNFTKMETNTKFKDNASGVEVYIKEVKDDLLTLSNGLKIKRDFFIKKFTPVYDDFKQVDNEEINPESFFGQKTDYLTDKKRSKMEEDIKKRQEEIKKLQENVNTPNEEIDPINFLHSPIEVKIDGLDNILNMDTSNIKEAPESQSRQVLIKESIDGKGGELNHVQNIERPKTDKEIAEAKRLSEAELSKYRQVDEDDDQAVRDFLEATGGKKDSIAKQAIVNTEPAISDEEQLTGKPTQKVKTEEKKIETKQTQTEPVDFISQMFKSFKRNYKIKINIDIEDYISEPDFIKLMSNNLDADIIGLYTKEILGRILGDVVGLEEKIRSVIKKEVYGEEKNPIEKYKKVRKEIDEEINNEELFPADKTKTKKQRFYFFDGERVVKLIEKSGRGKSYRAATKEEIKKYKLSKK